MVIQIFYTCTDIPNDLHTISFIHLINYSVENSFAFSQQMIVRPKYLIITKI